MNIPKSRLSASHDRSNTDDDLSNTSPSATEENPAHNRTMPEETSEVELPQSLIRDLRSYLPEALWRKLNQPRPMRRDLQAALNHLRSYLYLLSTYLPRHVVAQYRPHLAYDGAPDELFASGSEQKGSEMTGTLLFSDVSGFTQLSEKLARHGPDGIERLTTHLNAYFSRMLDILAQSNGVLLKFAGDALLVHFPALPENDQAAEAIRTAWRMMDALETISEADPASTTSFDGSGFTLRMKIGVATGSFHAVNAGTEQRREYIVLGEAVTRTMAAEGHAIAGQVVVDTATRSTFTDAAYEQITSEFFSATRLPSIEIGEYEIRAQTNRRGRSTAAWMGDSAQMQLEIAILNTRIQELSTYLPEELNRWLIKDAQRPNRHQNTTLHSENRPTVVTFVNVTGFEVLLQVTPTPFDRELVYGMIDDYFRAVYAATTRYGGMISRIDPYKDGNKLLILFGALQTHEDDAVRAIHAILDLQASLSILNRRWEHRLRNASGLHTTEPGIDQRAGITYGITFAGQVGASTRREYTVMGDEVNLAARLMGAAKPGQILASKAVVQILRRQHADDSVTLTPLPSIRVKGKSQPLAIFDVTARGSDVQSTLPELHPVLIGRDAELSEADSLISAALAGSGHRAAVLGSAGIGKSHFAAALSERLEDRGVHAVIARCPTFDIGAYTIWVSAVQCLAAINTNAAPEVQASQLRDFLAPLRYVEPAHIQALHSLLGLPYTSVTPAESGRVPHHSPPHSTSPARFGGLFARLVQQAPDQQKSNSESAPRSLWQVTKARQPSEQTGISITWDDLNARITRDQHTRLVRAMRALLKGLADQQPLVLIFEDAQNIDAASAELLNAITAEATSTPFVVFTVQRTEEAAYTEMDRELALPPLSASGTMMMVARLLSDHVDASRLQNLGESIYEKSLGNPLMVEELAAYWRDHKDEDKLTLDLHTSVTLSELVMSRMDRLPANLRIIVQAATIPDSDFIPEAVAVLLGPEGMDDIDVAHGLQDLADRQILHKAGSGAVSSYSFRQTLVREIVYGSLAAVRRRTYHDIFARYLETVATTLQPGRLAHHYEYAENWEAAGRYLVLSGDAAARQGALSQARSAFKAALSALARATCSEVTQKWRMRAQESIGDVNFHLESFALSATAYTMIDKETRKGMSVSSRDQFRIRAKRLLAFFASGDIATATMEAEILYRESEDYRFVVAAAAAWGTTRKEGPDAAEPAAEWRRKATVAQEIGNTIYARAILADLHGDWVAAREAYTLLEKPAGIALALCQQAEAWQETSEIGEAEIAYQAAERLWQRAENATGFALAACRRARLLQQENQHNAAESIICQAMAWIDSIDFAKPSDRAMIQSASTALKKHQCISEASQAWQACLDRLHARFLFHLLETSMQ